MTTLTIEGIDVDLALIDKAREVGKRLDALEPGLMELLDEAVDVYGRIYALVYTEAGDRTAFDDEATTRFRTATGAQRISNFLYEFGDEYHDHALRDHPVYNEAKERLFARWDQTRSASE